MQMLRVVRQGRGGGEWQDWWHGGSSGRIMMLLWSVVSDMHLFLRDRCADGARIHHQPWHCGGRLGAETKTYEVGRGDGQDARKG